MRPISITCMQLFSNFIKTDNNGIYRNILDAAG